MSHALDSPKWINLQLRADKLRLELKDFERAYAVENHGHKPSKDAIKANHTISRQYKDYNKIRDVLAGKLPAEVLNVAGSPKRRRSAATTTFVASPSRALEETTPRATRLHPSLLDPYDAPATASPHRTFLAAIGPTPQRDGQILGIFDMLSCPGSGRSLQETPSSRKRKAFAISRDDRVEASRVTTMIQTPTTSRIKQMGDLLEHLAGDTPASAVASSKHKHSRTPASDAKKFMLSQFFATPSAVRYTNVVQKSDENPGRVALGATTPLRDNLMRISPTKLGADVRIHADTTPAYLKRSYSFKDRLLSASNSVSHSRTSSFEVGSPTSIRIGPRPQRHAKFVPKALSQFASDMRKMEDEQHDDDLDALRELEADNLNTINNDSQTAAMNGDQPPFRTWKKKGQKRTTRRAVIRPSKMKSSTKPKFIAVEDEGNLADQGHDNESTCNEVTTVEETQFHDINTYSNLSMISDDELLDEITPQLPEQPRRTERKPRPQPDSQGGGQSDDQDEDENDKTIHDEDIHEDDEDNFSDRDSDFDEINLNADSNDNNRATGKQKTAAAAAAAAPAIGKQQPTNPDAATLLGSKQQNKKPKKTPGMINPNAQSHMNFRSLKIKNKNSRAKRAGGGRFGRRG